MTGGQSYWWRKPEYREKTTNLLQVTDKLFQIKSIKYHLTWMGIKWTILVVIGTDCIARGEYIEAIHTYKKYLFLMPLPTKHYGHQILLMILYGSTTCIYMYILKLMYG